MVAGRWTRADHLRFMYADPFFDLLLAEVNPTMDKANIVFRDDMRIPLHPDATGPSERPGAQKHPTGLRIQTVHQPKGFGRILPNLEMWRQVLLHPDVHLQFMLTFAQQ